MARTKIPHGTPAGYDYYECRCNKCRAANTERCRKRNGSKPRPPWQHGTANGYNRHGCRCAACTKAWAEYRRPRVAAYRARKRAERVAEGLRDA